MRKWLKCLALVIVIIFLIGFLFLGFSPDYRLYTGEGESMVPTFYTGDLLITQPLVGEVEPGMIVAYECDRTFILGQETGSMTYNNDKALIVHRVVSVEGQNLVTKGDANGEPDSWLVLVSDVKGVYWFKIPFLGYLAIIRIPLAIVLIVLVLGWYFPYSTRKIKSQNKLKRR